MVQLANSHRVLGEIVKCIESAIARVRVVNGIIKRHFNQIWNRAVSPSKMIDEINEDLLPTILNPMTDSPTLQFPFEDANFSSNRDPPAQVREEPVVQRSSRLAGNARPDYRKLGGVRPYYYPGNYSV